MADETADDGLAPVLPGLEVPEDRRPQIGYATPQAGPILPGLVADEGWQERENYWTQQRLAGAGEEDNPLLSQAGGSRYAIRRALPLVSAIVGPVDDVNYSLAQRAINEGRGTPNDHRTVASYEHEQRVDASRGLGGRILSGIAHIPAMVGEAALGGWALRGAGATAAVAPEAASLFSRAGMSQLGTRLTSLATREGAAGVARATPAFFGRTAAQTALMPSMWAHEWTQNNMANGREPLDWRGAPPAFAMGMAQTAVLGSLGEVGNSIPGRGIGGTALRLGVRTATGMAEQQGVDAAASLVENSTRDVFGYSMGLPTNYGVLGELIANGREHGLSHAVEQAATFAVFSAMHEAQHRPIQPGEPHPVMEQFQRSANALHESGMTREQAGQELTHVGEVLEGALHDNPNLNRPQALEIARQFPEGPLRDLAEAYAGAYPAKPYGPEVLGNQGRQASLADFNRTPAPTPAEQQGALPNHPVAHAFGESFPGATMTPGGVLTATVGTGEHQRTIDARELPNGHIHIAFSNATAELTDRNLAAGVEANRAGIGHELRPGTRVLVRALNNFAGKLKEQGRNIEYKATDGRIAPYARAMERAGFEQIGGPTGEGQGSRIWRPKVELTPEQQVEADRLHRLGIFTKAQAADEARVRLPAERPGPPPASAKPAGEQKPAAAPQTARERVSALEQEHLQTLGNIRDTQNRLGSLKEQLAMGQPRLRDVKAAQTELGRARARLKELERGLDEARGAAVQEEAAARQQLPSSAAPPSSPVPPQAPTTPAAPVGATRQPSPERTEALMNQARALARRAGLNTAKLLKDFDTVKSAQGDLAAEQWLENRVQALQGRGPAIPPEPAPQQSAQQRAVQGHIERALTHEDNGTAAEVFRHINQERTKKGLAKLPFKDVREVLDGMVADGRLERFEFGPNEDPIFVPRESDEVSRAEVEAGKQELYQRTQALIASNERAFQESLNADAKRSARKPPPLYGDVERDVQKAGEAIEAAASPANASGNPGGSGHPSADAGRHVAASNQLTGAETTIAAPGGSVRARYEVRELDSVTASNRVLPGGAFKNRAAAGEYPAGLQPRDYSKNPAEQAKILRFANEMVPAYWISHHPDSTSGPPVITRDGTVINGNGRNMALEMAVHRGTFEKYKAELARQAAAFGLDPAAVAKMKQPVLYRVVDMNPASAEAQRFARVGNVAPTQSQGIAEQAAAFAHLIPSDIAEQLRLGPDTTLSEAISGDAGRALRERVLQAIRSNAPSAEADLFERGGKAALTDKGKEFLRQMLLVKVMPPELIQSLGEQRRQLMNGIERAIPQLLLFQRSGKGADITPQLVDALGVFSRHPEMRTRADVDLVARQGDLFSGGANEPLTPGSRMLLDFLVEQRDKPARLREGLVRLAEASDLKRGGLFGDQLPSMEQYAAEVLGVDPRPGASFGGESSSPAANQHALNNVRGEIDHAKEEAVQSGSRLTAAQEALQAGREAGEAQGQAEIARRRAGAEATNAPRREPTAGPAGSDPDVFFHRPGESAGIGAGGTAAAAPGEPGEPGRRGGGVGPFDIIATQNELLATRNYVEKAVPHDPNASAAALSREEAIVTNKMAAGDPKINLEEHAHILAVRLGLETNPAILPREVAQGFREFFNPNAPMSQRTMMEGFAQWMVRRAAGQLDGLTPAQTAANKFAEAWVKEKGLVKALDRIGAMHQELDAQGAGARAAGLTSTTGQPAQPDLTRGERVRNWVQESLDSQNDKKLDDLGPLTRAEAADLKRTGSALPAGTAPSEVFRQMRFRQMPLVEEMTKKGVFAYDENGQQRIVGRSLADIAQRHGLTPEELKNGGLVDRYMRALEAVHMEDVGRPNRSAEQHKELRAALKEMQADPDVMRRVAPAAAEITDQIFNASLRAMEMSGFLAEGTVDVFRESNPFYTPNKRIMDPETGEPSKGVNWKKRGEEAPSPGFLKSRSGSGEQVVGLQDAIRDRLEYTAFILTKQAKDRAFHDFFRREGHGSDVLFANMKPSEITADTFTPQSWPKDGSKPSYVMMIDGQPVRARIGDRPLYELITGQQGDRDTIVQVAKATANFTRPIAQLQRLGFTVLSPLYHLHNLMPWRDAATYISRTTSEKGLIRDVGNVYEWYGKSMLYYSAKLFGFDTGNVHFKLYDELTQRSLTATGETFRGGSKPTVVDGWRGLVQRVIDLAGFGEKALHVAEMKNVWDRSGFTTEKLKAGAGPENPVPLQLQIAALNAAAEVTHNFNTMGYQVRELNKAWPFLGVHIASAYKDISTFKDRPLIAMRGLAVLAAMKTLEWWLYKDDEEYQQLGEHRRDGFVFKVPGIGWVGMPGPRGIQTPILGLISETLRATSNSNPQFGSLLGRTLEHVGPSGGPSGLTTAAELLANRRRLLGAPIIPRRDENLPASHNFLHHQLPYAASQLTGGIVDPRHWNPGTLALPPQHQMVDQVYDELHALEGQRALARRQGVIFRQEPEYQVLHRTADRIRQLSQALRGDNRIGSRLAPGEAPPAERQAALRAEQIRLARQALEMRQRARQ